VFDTDDVYISDTWYTIQRRAKNWYHECNGCIRDAIL